jgi:hypothetical protein
VAGTRAIAPELLSSVIDVVAASGTLKDWEQIYAQFKSAKTPQDETRYLFALADFVEPAMIERTLELYQSPAVKIQDGLLAMSRALMNRHARQTVWTLVEREWDTLLAKYPHSMMQYLIGPVGRITEDRLADRASAWLDQHPVAEATRQIAQAKEFQAIHRRLAHEVRKDLPRILTAD